MELRSSGSLTHRPGLSSYESFLKQEKNRERLRELSSLLFEKSNTDISPRALCYDDAGFRSYRHQNSNTSGHVNYTKNTSGFTCLETEPYWAVCLSRLQEKKRCSSWKHSVSDVPLGYKNDILERQEINEAVKRDEKERRIEEAQRRAKKRLREDFVRAQSLQDANKNTHRDINVANINAENYRNKVKERSAAKIRQKREIIQQQIDEAMEFVRQSKEIT